MNTEDNEREKVVQKDKEEDMDWLVESGTDESDDQSVVSTKGSKRKTVITSDDETDEATEESANNSKANLKSVHKYQCPHNNCGKGFRFIRKYRDHRHDIHSELLCKYSGCVFGSQSMRNIKKHSLEAHPMFACLPICGQQFASLLLLNKHLKIVHKFEGKAVYNQEERQTYLTYTQ